MPAAEVPTAAGAAAGAASSAAGAVSILLLRTPAAPDVASLSPVLSLLAAERWPHINVSDSLVMADGAVKMAEAGCT